MATRRPQHGVGAHGAEAAHFRDHLAPVGIGRRQAEAEEAERGDGDRDIAHAQAGIDDQRSARIGQQFDDHDVERPLAAHFRRGDIVARLEVEHEAAHDAHHLRRGAEA